jgi:ABC-2 type transport system ATP-binding protein
MMPIRSPLPVVQAAGEWELPGIAVEVSEGQQLFLTVSPLVDQFIGMQSRVPGLFVLEDAAVHLHVVE